MNQMRGYEPGFAPGELVPLGTPIRLRRVVIEEDLGLVPDTPEAKAIARVRKFSQGPQGNTGKDLREAIDAMADVLELLLERKA